MQVGVNAGRVAVVWKMAFFWGLRLFWMDQLVCLTSVPLQVESVNTACFGLIHSRVRCINRATKPDKGPLAAPDIRST